MKAPFSIRQPSQERAEAAARTFCSRGYRRVASETLQPGEVAVRFRDGDWLIEFTPKAVATA